MKVIGAVSPRGRLNGSTGIRSWRLLWGTPRGQSRSRVGSLRWPDWRSSRIASICRPPLRFGRTVSVLTSISMTLTFITFVIWDVALYVQANQAHAAGAIVVSYPRHDLWLPIMLALGLACLASIFG